MAHLPEDRDGLNRRNRPRPGWVENDPRREERLVWQGKPAPR